MKRPKNGLKPETLNMRGAAQQSLRTAYAHYLDWCRANAQDLEATDMADPNTFLDWAADELEAPR